MTSRTRTTSNTEQAKTAKPTPRKTAAKKPTAKKTTARPARNTAEKTPRLSLVKPTPTLPTRTRDFMTDTQGHATLAALTAGIPTHRIRDWRDHRNGTATRPLHDGSLLHYQHATRTLTWQAECPMGAVHTYRLDSPSAATWARINATRCQTAHADLSAIPALTPDELAALGILHTTDRPTLPGDDPVTETIPIPLPEPEPRTLADTLAHSDTSTADTQPIPTLTAPADNDQPKEHTEP